MQLNNVEVGGATVFPELNLAARPVKARLILCSAADIQFHNWEFTVEYLRMCLIFI